MNIKLSFKNIFLLVCSISYGQNPDNNLLNTSSWVVGTGAVTGFSINGSASENSRELGLNHVGEEVVLWKAIPDSGNNADGGWESDFITINNNNSYRLSVWIKKSNSNDGTTYFGCQRINYTNADYNILNLNNTLNTNPYFWNGDLPKLDRWYLLIAYVHNKNYSTTVSLGKIYDGVTGEMIWSTISDKKFDTSTTRLSHRAYLYFDTNTLDRQFFYAPRVEVVDGTEWTLDQLLSINPDSKLLFVYDNAGNQKQRFYCAVANCTAPNPPAGRIVSDNGVATKEVEEEPIDESIMDLNKMLTLFPNPTKALVSLSLNTDSNTTLSHDINIYNTAGLLVKAIPSNAKNELEIDFTNLAAGMYLVHIHLSNGKSVTKHVIKN